jgi:hypothetical protein
MKKPPTVIFRAGTYRVVLTEYGYFDLEEDGEFVKRFDNHQQFLNFASFIAEAARVSELQWWATDRKRT